MGMATNEASQGRCPAFACFEYSLGFFELPFVIDHVTDIFLSRLLYRHMMNFDENGNENRLEHITAFWKVSIRALHNCLDAQPVAVVDVQPVAAVDVSPNPSDDAILDKRFGYAGLYVEVVWIIRVELLDDFGFSSPSICLLSLCKITIYITIRNTDFDVFSRYSQLCARCSSNSPQPSNSSKFGTTQHPDLDVFEKYSHLYAKSTTTRSSATSLDTVHTSIVRNAPNYL
ncbi:hypothetical protein Tco_0134466 [Tanacetum coccineum]